MCSCLMSDVVFCVVVRCERERFRMCCVFCGIVRVCDVGMGMGMGIFVLLGIVIVIFCV